MPVIIRKKLSEHSCIAIWQITEHTADLIERYDADESEKKTISEFSHEFRKRQWIAVRLLLHELIPNEKIRYDENGKPWPKNSNCFISLSHSGPLIAVYVCDRPCGIDIEHIRPKIERIAPRFLNAPELHEAKKEPMIIRMHAYWCVKEAAYKVNGKKNVSLRDHIHVHSFINTDSGNTSVDVKTNESSHSFAASFEKQGEYMLAWTPAE